jgi:hypothetical protein
MELEFVVFLLQHKHDKNQFQPTTSVPGLSSDPSRHREYRGDGDDREDTANRSYRKTPLLLKSKHLMFTKAHTHARTHAHTHTHTHKTCSLSWFFRSVPWMTLSQQTSATLLASWHPSCNTIPTHLQQRSEPKAGIAEWAEQTLTCWRKPKRKIKWVLNRTLSSHGSLLPGSNLERAASGLCSLNFQNWVVSWITECRINCNIQKTNDNSEGMIKLKYLERNVTDENWIYKEIMNGFH